MQLICCRHCWKSRDEKISCEVARTFRSLMGSIARDPGFPMLSVTSVRTRCPVRDEGVEIGASVLVKINPKIIDYYDEGYALDRSKLIDVTGTISALPDRPNGMVHIAFDHNYREYTACDSGHFHRDRFSILRKSNRWGCLLKERRLELGITVKHAARIGHVSVEKWKEIEKSDDLAAVDYENACRVLAVNPGKFYTENGRRVYKEELAKLRRALTERS